MCCLTVTKSNSFLRYRIDSFCLALQWVDYAERCLRAAKVLQKLLALSLGLDRDFFDQAGYFDKPTCLLGINRYKFPTKMKNGEPIPPEMYQRWIEGDPLGKI